MFTPSRGKALGRAITASSAGPVTLPGFLVPAWQATTTTAPRATAPFSTTPKRPSKLGRTPLSIPPGVEISLGDLKAKKDLTSYKQVFKRFINVKGPLGEDFCWLFGGSSLFTNASYRRVESRGSRVCQAGAGCRGENGHAERRGSRREAAKGYVGCVFLPFLSSSNVISNSYSF